MQNGAGAFTRADELWWLCGCVDTDDLHAALSIYCHLHGKEHDVPWMEKILSFTALSSPQLCALQRELGMYATTALTLAKAQARQLWSG